MEKLTCCSCGQSLPKSDFYENRHNATGHATECRRCCRERAQAARDAKKELFFKYEAAFHELQRLKATQKN